VLRRRVACPSAPRSEAVPTAGPKVPYQRVPPPPVWSCRSRTHIKAASASSPRYPFAAGAPLHPRRHAFDRPRWVAGLASCHPPSPELTTRLLAPPREAAPRSSSISRHFLLPRGHIPDGSPLRPPFKHSITIMSFDLSSLCSPTTSPAPSTNGLPHHCCSPTA
jgi:hypothetical protein